MSEGLDLDSQDVGVIPMPNFRRHFHPLRPYGCRCLGRWRKSCAYQTVQEARFGLNCSYVDLQDIEDLIFKRMM